MVPEWIKQIISSSDLKCPDCNNSYGVNDLLFMGIKNVKEKEEKQCLCIGMTCRKCDQMVTFDVGDMTLIDFALEILENEAQAEEEKEDKNKKFPQNKKFIPKKNTKKSQITIKDVKDAATTLSRISTHEEFLMILGMTPEEIREYDYQPTHKNKDNKNGDNDDGKSE